MECTSRAKQRLMIKQQSVSDFTSPYGEFRLHCSMSINIMIVQTVIYAQSARLGSRGMTTWAVKKMHILAKQIICLGPCGASS